MDQTSDVSVRPTMQSSMPVKLWTPGFIGGVSFLLGFPAGIVIAAINWMRMKMNDKAIIHLVAGGGGTFVFVLLLIFTSATAGRILGLLANLGVLFYLQNQMKKDIENFRSANHTIENAGQFGGCLIGLSVLLMFVVLVFGLGVVFALLGVPISN